MKNLTLMLGDYRPPETWDEQVKENEEMRVRREECRKRERRTSQKGYDRIMDLAGKAAAAAPPKEK
ncbi:MAG: hypothetical protein LBQ79_00465 [Deltaproteobacteria bacterium]|jgi:hypothetical protein|nr:hypothetical protein [Deltaproteobacteria bacterium]